MNKQILKKIRDNMPEPLKHVTASFIRNRLVKNGGFRKYYQLLQEREKLDAEKIKEFQFEQLKSVLIYASRNVPYYEELFDSISFDPLNFSDFDQIKKIPFLTRELVTQNYQKLISREKVANGYYGGSTGGSTGSPLNFVLDYDSVYKENAFLYYYRRKLGYNFEDRLVTFRGIDLNHKTWQYNPMYNETIFSPMGLSKVTIHDYARRVNDVHPKYLNGYLSALWFFTKLLEQNNLKLDSQLKGIFLMSENIDPEKRAYIEDFYKVRSIAHYGHSERCVLAYETGPGMYCFDPYYGYGEQIKTEDDNYLIVGTGFLNRSMPFIRYRTDDYCTPVNSHFRIEGKRSTGLGLYGYNGEFIVSSSFLDLFKHFTNYQFIQKEKGKADMLIVSNSEIHEKDIHKIQANIDAHTKGIIDINVKLVDNLILSPRGKFQMYISELQDQNFTS
jgi:phenylacetate-CoA ligase